MARKIQIRRGTAANMPVLADGELGLQTDTGKLYIGCAGTNVEVAMGAELIRAIAGCAPSGHTHTAAQVGLGSVDNVSADQIRRGGGKHLAGQGAANGYSFLGDGAEDTGLFSDSDGNLYVMLNGQRYNFPDFCTPDGSKSVNYANSANYANGAGNANALGGVGAGEFYRSNNKPFVSGVYTGNGDDRGGQRINLGFTASAVLVETLQGVRPTGSSFPSYQGGLAVLGSPMYYDRRENLIGVQIDGTAFWAGWCCNYLSMTYHYIAFR